MAELDFSKTFGETATSKASFTDENYLRGWGYLGSTPPPYQLFDYLQSLNDKKSKYLYDKVNENDNNLSTHNTNATAHQPILDLINTNQTALNNNLSNHNTNATAHTDIRQMFTWKKLYSTKYSTFVMPASGVALFDIPSAWKELNVTWAWWGEKISSYTTNIINESTEGKIIFSNTSNVSGANEGEFFVENNKFYINYRGQGSDGTPVLVMWR